MTASNPVTALETAISSSNTSAMRITTRKARLVPRREDARQSRITRIAGSRTQVISTLLVIVMSKARCADSSTALLQAAANEASTLMSHTRNNPCE